MIALRWRLLRFVRAGRGRLGRERQTCPRRMREAGPWERAEGLDRWRRGQWGSALGRAWEAFWASGWRARLLTRTFGGTTWRWPWQPAVCSFCGGVRPDDALRLLGEGWELEGTDKGYKAYLNSPGTASRRHRAREWFDARAAALATRRPEPPAPWDPAWWSAGPPVKVYWQHWTEEEIQEAGVVVGARGGSEAG